MNQDYNEQNKPAEEPIEHVSEVEPAEHIKSVKRRTRQKNFIFALILIAAIVLSSVCTFSATYNTLQARYSVSLSSESASRAELEAKIAELTEENLHLTERVDAADRAMSGRARRLTDLRTLATSLQKNQAEAAELLTRLRRLIDEA